MANTIVFAISLLLGAAAAAHAAEPLFRDYLESYKQTGGRVEAKHYRRGGRESVCFRTSKSCQLTCDSPPSCFSNYHEIDNLVCTQCEGYPLLGGGGLNDQLANAMSAGQCTFYRHENLTGVALADNPGVLYIGNFYGSCTIRASGACSLPEVCSDVTINMQGGIYSVTDAIRIGPAANYEFTCESAFRRGSQKTATRGAQKKVETAAATPAADVYHGPAYVFMGMAQVFSNDLRKITPAFFQYSAFGDTNTSPIVGTPPSLPDDVFRFDFATDNQY